MNAERITPNPDDSTPYDWSHSLTAEDAKYWRQEEVHRLNPTEEMNITPIPHTNEGEATGWMMGVDLVTIKRQQALRVAKGIKWTVRLALAVSALGAVMFLVGSIQAALGGN